MREGLDLQRIVKAVQKHTVYENCRESMSIWELSQTPDILGSLEIPLG